MNPVDQRYSSQVVVDQRHCMAVVLHEGHPSSIVGIYADNLHSVVERVVGIVVDS
jgi:hypothetical protein